jgi:hypothetical protein
MGLIYNIIISIVHLLFVAIDIFLLMIAIKAVYDRWRPSWLKQAINATEPIVNCVCIYAGRIVSNLTGKTYSQKMLLLLIVICLLMVRLVVASLI